MSSSSATNVLEAAQVPLHRAAVRNAGLDPANQLVRMGLDLAVADQRAEQGCPLPLVMPVDLGHRGPKPLPQPSLDRVQLLALPLQVVRLPEEQPKLDQRDERTHEPKIRRPSLGWLFEGLFDLLGLEQLEDVALLDEIGRA